MEIVPPRAKKYFLLMEIVPPRAKKYFLIMEIVLPRAKKYFLLMENASPRANCYFHKQETLFFLSKPHLNRLKTGVSGIESDERCCFYSKTGQR
jgi:hypothetical protein